LKIEIVESKVRLDLKPRRLSTFPSQEKEEEGGEITVLCSNVLLFHGDSDGFDG
jgi:hypothetical protein